jgi:phosphoglycerol transferase MdoB-like AlkP superfamily enzyme
MYAVLVLYIAINVPIARVLSSPLTWTMIRAARGPLLDSIRFYVTPSTIASIILVLAAGLLMPLALARLRPSVRPILILAAIVVMASGPLASTRIETSGFHRNAFGVLWPVHVGQTAVNDGRGFRNPPIPEEAPLDELTRFRGLAAGRNVLLIALESTAAQYLSIYGAAKDPTPNLTKLAQHAIVFDRGYTVYPESIKGLFAVLCSRYPAFQTPAETDARGRCTPLAQSLADAGYQTSLFHSGRFMYLGMEDLVRNRGFQTLEDAGAIGGNVNSSFGIDEPAAVARILTWIDSLPKNQPFFITYLPVAGHHPYATPERGPFREENEFGGYLNALHYGDQAFGELLHGLRERNLEEKTLFVIYGDHGEAFGQHDGNIGHSLFIYDENVRVPFVIAAPGLIEEQVRVRQTASLIDTAPTILDLLGRPVPPDSQGLSLLNPSNNMALFFTDYSLGFLGLYDSCWKYIYEIESDRSKLFDVCRDSEETADLSAQQSLRVNAYRENLKTWIGSVGRNPQAK